MACCQMTPSRYLNQCDLPWKVFYDIHLRAISQEEPINLIHNIYLEFTLVGSTTESPRGQWVIVNLWVRTDCRKSHLPLLKNVFFLKCYPNWLHAPKYCTKSHLPLWKIGRTYDRLFKIMSKNTNISKLAGIHVSADSIALLSVRISADTIMTKFWLCIWLGLKLKMLN